MGDLVSIIVSSAARGEGLRRSVESAEVQSHDPVEVVVVGGRRDPRATGMLSGLESRPFVRVAESVSGAPGALLNAGTRAAKGTLLVWLDEGDRLQADFCATAIRAMAADPAIGYVLAPGVMSPGGEPLAPEFRVDWDARAIVGTTWCAPMAMLCRRSIWESAGGFDEEVEALEHYDFLLRIERTGARGRVLDRPGLWHAAARETRHRQTLEADVYRAGLQAVFDRQRATFEADPAAVLFDRERTLRELVRVHRQRVARRDEALDRLRLVTHEVGRIRTWLQQEGRDGFDWGDFDRTSPVSRNWGYDRGTPIDRYYIEQFIGRHAADVRGVVLEVQENDLTTRFGANRVTRSEVIDVNPGNARATIIDDLRRVATMADDTFDCIILTQTLHVIDDMRAVLVACHRILKPGGALLATLPCASRVCLEYGPDGDFWRVTEAGARALFHGVFPPDRVQARSFGNVQVNAAFLHGLAVHEIEEAVFAEHDPYFPLLVGVRAVKPASPGASGGRPGSGRRAGPHPGAILMYHRVAEASPDVHGLCVRPDDFAHQMAALRQHFHPMPLVDLVETVRRGELPEGAVAVTFDDGYLDGLTTAKPILEAHGIPATFFVSTDELDVAHEYWWDTLERVFFGPYDLPTGLDFLGAGVELSFQTRTAEERRTGHWQLYRSLMGHDVETRDQAVRVLLARSRAGRSPRPGARPMTTGELRALAENPAFAIGAHGVHHLSLPSCAEEVQRAEVAECKRTLEDILGRPVTTFAYPFGSWSFETSRIVREAGFTLAVTCEDQIVRPGGDPWRLPRFDVRPGVGAHFARRLFAFLDRRD